MAQQHTNDHLTIKFVKESIEERLYTYGIDCKWFSEEKLKQTFASVLSEDSEDYYQVNVQKLCKLSSDRAVRLESLTQPDLQAVWEKVEELWPPNVYIPDFRKSTNAYIFCKPSLGGGTEPCVMAHITILEYLYRVTVETCDRYRNMKLLSLCLWAFYFYTKKKYNYQRHQRTYNSTSHAFHSDLVICFIALQCRFTPVADDTKIPVMPQFKHTIIHYGISPEHPAFHRLVLREMLKIIIPGCKFNNLQQQNAVAIAEFIYSFLLPGGFSWSHKGYNAILFIISDQSRYMALRQPDIRRNYVADKTRRVLSAATRILLRYYFIRPLPALRDDTDDLLGVFNHFMKEAHLTASWDDGIMLPPLTKKPDTRMLNFLHHLILIEICRRIPGYHCPPIDEHGRFMLEDKDFIKEVRKLASTSCCKTCN